jgi:hydroxymethylbilane synthase
MQKIRIITRNSKLAMWQAHYVEQQLKFYYPELLTEIIGITTEGDRILDKSLEKIGGKGLFIKELEYQLLMGKADIAVHSLKDLPANLASEFALAAILKREDPRDAFVSNHFNALEELPNDAVVGTSSARRSAILRKYYPHLRIKLLRGNLQTRLAKLDANEYDAIILAVAGLTRLNLADRIKQVLAVDEFIPAIGQGVLAIEVCSNRPELIQLIKVLNDTDSFLAVSAEREMGKYMNASCNIPIAGFATVSGGELKLKAILADPSEDCFLTASASGDKAAYLEIGQQCARELS